MILLKSIRKLNYSLINENQLDFFDENLINKDEVLLNFKSLLNKKDCVIKNFVNKNLN